MLTQKNIRGDGGEAQMIDITNITIKQYVQINDWYEPIPIKLKEVGLVPPGLGGPTLDNFHMYGGDHRCELPGN